MAQNPNHQGLLWIDTCRIALQNRRQCWIFPVKLSHLQRFGFVFFFKNWSHILYCVCWKRIPSENKQHIKTFGLIWYSHLACYCLLPRFLKGFFIDLPSSCWTFCPHQVLFLAYSKGTYFLIWKAQQSSWLYFPFLAIFYFRFCCVCYNLMLSGLLWLMRLG